MAKKKTTFLDIYCTNYQGPKAYSPNVQIRQEPVQTNYVQETLDNSSWDQYNFYLNKQSFSNVLKWMIFIGAKPLVNADRTISDYAFNLDCKHLNLLLDLCKQEIALPQITQKRKIK